MKNDRVAWLLPVLAGVIALAAQVLQAQPVTEFDSSASEMRPAIESFAADHASLSRALTVQLSPGRHERFKQFFTDWEARLVKLNFESMSQEGKVDYVLLRNRLDHDLRQLDLDS